MFRSSSVVCADMLAAMAAGATKARTENDATRLLASGTGKLRTLFMWISSHVGGIGRSSCGIRLGVGVVTLCRPSSILAALRIPATLRPLRGGQFLPPMAGNSNAPSHGKQFYLPPRWRRISDHLGIL